jgi:predicted regulator of Ras-like GTPase activity (Roadblock/LC7/MglB family)
MTPTPPTPLTPLTPLTAHEKAICERGLADLVQAATGVDTALIATPDGFEVAYMARVRTVDAARLAAMSSSMLALGDAMARELKFKTCTQIMLEATGGFLLVSALPCARAELVLSALAPTTSTLGMAMVAMRKCAKAIGGALDRRR